MRFFVYEYACCQLPDRSADAEALRAEGHAMLTAVCADLAALPGAAVETMEPPDDEADFRRRAAAADFTLVIAPELDGLLLDRCRWVEEAGGRLLGSSSAAVRLAGDKLLLADHLCARGVPTPPVWPLRDALRGGGAPFPVVVKRRDGAGSLGTFLAGDRHSLEHGARSLDVDRFLVQPLVPGTAASVALLIGPRQTLTLAPALQHLSQDGRFQYQGGEAPLPEPLAGRAEPLARRAVEGVDGLAGYVGVDLVLGPDKTGDWVLEINPRLTTSYVGLRALWAGNLAKAMLDVLVGRPVRPAWHPGRVRWRADGWRDGPSSSPLPRFGGEGLGVRG